MRALRPVLLLLLLTPALLPAQTWVSDTLSLRLAWGTANVLVQRDSSRGVKVWAVTSRVIRDTPTRNFAASFDPDSAVLWLAYADKVVNFTGRPSDSASVRLQTPVLRATDGSELLIVRRRDGKKWDAHPQLFLIGPKGLSPWYIESNRKEMQQFLTLMFRQAGASAFRPTLDTLPTEPNPIDPVSCPTLLVAGKAEYPAALQNGPGGEVWLTYVVRADGTADPNSFHVALSDAPEFTRAAVYAVMQSRFRPAQQGAVPIDARVHQRAVFLPYYRH
jgi:hypothetical protein